MPPARSTALLYSDATAYILITTFLYALLTVAVYASSIAIVLSDIASAKNSLLHPNHTTLALITALAWMRDDFFVASMTRDELCVCNSTPH